MKTTHKQEQNSPERTNPERKICKMDCCQLCGLWCVWTNRRAHSKWRGKKRLSQLEKSNESHMKLQTILVLWWLFYKYRFYVVWILCSVIFFFSFSEYVCALFTSSHCVFHRRFIISSHIVYHILCFFLCLWILNRLVACVVRYSLLKAFDIWANYQLELLVFFSLLLLQSAVFTVLCSPIDFHRKLEKKTGKLGFSIFGIVK